MGLVQMAYVLPALDHLRAGGVPLHRHLRAVALSDFALDDAQAFVPAACVTALLERIAAKELSSDPIGDLETAYRLKHTHHYGDAVLCAANLRAAALLASDPASAVITYNTLELKIDGPVATITDRYACPGRRGERIMEGLSLLLLLDAMIEFGGRHCRPIALDFTGHAMPGHSIPIDLSETRIRLGQQDNRATFDARWLGQTSRSSKALQLAPDWAPEDRVSLRLTAILRSLDTDVRPTLQHVAKLADMSPRTLQRRLSEEGTTFFEVLDSWRFGQAVKLISAEDTTVADIALLTGYSDTPHFIRAFKRWTGVSPQAYRDAM